MKSWPTPFIPAIPGHGPTVRVHDTSTGELREAAAGERVGLYVCGITPYDATHLGHAATYVTFDLLGRALRDAGHEVTYVQNVTDIDDPLFERAARDGVSWQDLGNSEIDLFREDMTDLAVIPPDQYVGVVESIESISAAVADLLASGAAYALPAGEVTGSDVYLDLAQRPGFGAVSHWTRQEMLEVYADRGGDPDRAGKRDALDPLLWRAARPGEPSWDHPVLGPGRPGWHIECTAIAQDHLGVPFAVQGGGTDLIFPHHEMSATQSEGLTGGLTYAANYVHQAMVGYHGEKMSKSKGNLVKVSVLRRDGVDPMAIRLVLLAHDHRSPWEYTEDALVAAEARLARWREALSVNTGPSAETALTGIRQALADGLDSPAALAAVDAWAEQCLAEGGDDPAGPGIVARACDALLGVRI